MNHKQPPRNGGQIRLLIPLEWIAELDTLAEAKFKTRLAIIREYLRDRIDHDMSQLNEIITRREQLRRAKQNSDRWLQQRNKSEDDQW